MQKKKGYIKINYIDEKITIEGTMDVKVADKRLSDALYELLTYCRTCRKKANRGVGLGGGK